MPIADCQFPIWWRILVFNIRSRSSLHEIGNWQSEIGNESLPIRNLPRRPALEQHWGE
jgi:hypothetical protein